MNRDDLDELEPTANRVSVDTSAAAERSATLLATWQNALATYNAEQARGLIHTARWVTRMAMLQKLFDAAMLKKQEKPK